MLTKFHPVLGVQEILPSPPPVEKDPKFHCVLGMVQSDEEMN